MTGFDKGSIALRIINDTKPDFIVCIGDDATDEDMFKVLKDKAYNIKVSGGATAARYSVFSQPRVLTLLNRFMLPVTEKQYVSS